MLETRQDIRTAGGSLYSRYIDIGIGKFPVHFHIGDENLMQARVIDLPDEHFREILTDPVCYALKTNTRWHGLLFIRLLQHEALDRIADFDVIEILQADAALEALANLAHIIFLMF